MSNVSRRHFCQFTSSMFATIGLSQFKLLQGENYRKVLAQSSGEYIISGNPNEAKIALTFDDGPYDVTSKLLDELRNNDVKATFFCVRSRVEDLPDIAKRIVNEGHLIANHSDDNSILRELDDNDVLRKLGETNEVIQKVTGHKPEYFRPPQGYPPFSGERDIDGSDVARVTRLAREELGLTHVHWSLNTNDWQSPGVDRIVESLMSAQNGSIILCHDLPPNGDQKRGEDTVEAIKQAIPKLKETGLSFVTIKELNTTWDSGVK